MRPDYCPLAGEPCQSMCDKPCSANKLKINPEQAALEQQAEPVHGDIRALKYRIHELEGEVMGYKRMLDVAEAASQPQQQAEPAAWVVYGNVSDEKHAVDYQQEDIDAISVGTMLYTAPPQRKPLTDEQVKELFMKDLGTDYLDDFVCGIRAAEAAHGIKEGT